MYPCRVLPNMSASGVSVSMSLYNRKKAVQVLLKDQKRLAQTITTLEGNSSEESMYAWKVVKALEKKKHSLNEEEHYKNLGIKDDLFDFK